MGIIKAAAGSVGGVMAEQWTAQRGFEVTSLAISEVNADGAGLRMIRELERDKALTDPTLAGAHIVGAQADAMRSAAKNLSGGGIGVIAAVNAVPNQQNTVIQNEAPSMWTCECGSVNSSKFCPECGKKRPD